MNERVNRGGTAAILLLLVGCAGANAGGGETSATGPTAAGATAPAAGPTSAPQDRTAPATVAVGTPPPAPSASSIAPAPAPAPEARPFASNGAEATSMIDDAVEKKAGPILKCVEAARTRRKTPHGKIAIEIGIDQEGTLIGVKTAKGQPKDGALDDCMRQALADAPFPRSHAGVITLTKTFEDQPITK